MQPGFVDFPNLAQGFGFASREAPGRFRKPTRWNFTRAVTQGSNLSMDSSKHVTR